MMPNAKIEVWNGATLSIINQSTVYGCQKLWNRIEVQAGAGVNLQNSTFRDALFAVNFLPGFSNEKTNVKNCTFTNNNICVYIGKTGLSHHTQQYDLVSFTPIFESNHFTCTPVNNTTDQFAILPAPNSNSIGSPLIGIYMQHCNGYITSNNLFENIGTGYVSIANSTFLIWNQEFDNLRKFASNLSSSSGTGILGVSSFLWVQNCSFAGNDIGGCLFKAMNGLILNENNFDSNDEYGVIANDNKFNEFRFWVINNRFNLNRHETNGILIDRSFGQFSPDFVNKIEGNQITMVHKAGIDRAGISLDLTQGGENATRIKNNTIKSTDLAKVVNGIVLTGNPLKLTSNTIVDSNLVDYTNNKEVSYTIGSFGITAQGINGSGNVISQNTVLAKLFPFGFFNTSLNEGTCSHIKCAFHIDNSSGLKVCSNITNETGRGYHFGGKLGFCDFAGNTIGRHFQGMICVKNLTADADTDLGSTTTLDLRHHKNTWGEEEYNYVQTAARYSDQSSAPGIFKFYVKNVPGILPPTVMIGGGTNATNSTTGGGWFLIDNTPEAASTSHCSGVDFAPAGGESHISHSDTLVISGTYPTNAPSAGWDSKRDLLQKLMKYPNLRPSGSLMNTFFLSESNSSPYKFAEAIVATNDAPKVSNAWQANLSSLKNQQFFWMDSLGKLLKIKNPTTAIQQKKTNLLAQISTLTSSLESQQAQIATQTTSNLNNSLSIVQNLPQTNIWEQNLKTILKAEITTNLGGTLSNSQINDLRQIANQCSMTGGQNIRSAAFWLPIQEKMEVFSREGETNCTQYAQEAENRNETKPSEQTQIIIYPNPVGDKLNVFIQTADSGNGGNWHLADLNGHIIDAGQVKSTQNTFEILTDKIPSGVYIFILKTNTGVFATQKVVIIH